jgi:hypothetical protein
MGLGAEAEGIGGLLPVRSHSAPFAGSSCLLTWAYAARQVIGPPPPGCSPHRQVEQLQGLRATRRTIHLTAWEAEAAELAGRHAAQRLTEVQLLHATKDLQVGCEGCAKGCRPTLRRVGLGGPGREF